MEKFITEFMELGNITFRTVVTIATKLLRVLANKTISWGQYFSPLILDES